MERVGEEMELDIIFMLNCPEKGDRELPCVESADSEAFDIMYRGYIVAWKTYGGGVIVCFNSGDIKNKTEFLPLIIIYMILKID